MPKLFTDEEYKTLVIRAVPDKGATAEQIQLFIQDCEHLKSQSLLLQAIQDGLIVCVGYNSEGPLYGRPARDP